MKRTLLLSFIAAGILAAPMAFAEGDKAEHDGKRGKGGHMMEKVDTNADGLISKDEFMAKHEEMFNKMDANSDGSLSKEELKTSMKERHGKRKERRGDRKESKESDAESAAE
jgi:Ni/Co efflux regulator RcnB